MNIKGIFFLCVLVLGDSLNLSAQSVNILRKDGNSISFSTDDVESVEFSPEAGVYNFDTDYLSKWDYLSSTILALKNGDRQGNLTANKYIERLLAQYGSYEKISETPDISPVISLSDDDLIDAQLDGLFTTGRTGGFFSTLYPLAASIGAPVTEAVEGHRVGTIGKLSTKGAIAKLLAKHAGWELANHTMDACYGLALPVKTFAEIPPVDKIPSPANGVLTDRKYVYIEDEGKCYSYENGIWTPVEKHKEPPYLMNSSGKAIADNPCFDFEYEVWKNQDLMESLLGFRPVTYVQPVNQSSKKRAEYVKASHKYMMNGYSNDAIELPLATTTGRMSLDDAVGSSNEATDELFEKWKQDLNDVLENGKSIVLLLHAYRSCWSNEISHQLVSMGGVYPDEWVHPTNLPVLNLCLNVCMRFQNNTFLDYVKSPNYDCLLFRIPRGASRLILEGANAGSFVYFCSNRISPETYIGKNNNGIIPINAKYAIVNMKKADNPDGYSKLSMKSVRPITYNHCARTIRNAGVSSFRDYVPSPNYDCMHMRLDPSTSKISITGAIHAGYHFFSSSNFGKETFVGTDATGKVPVGARYAIVNFKKAENPQGYSNLKIEESYDNKRVDWMSPHDDTNLESWSAWHPCPGTRLYQLWKLLKYAKEKGVSFMTISENMDRMQNRVEGGYFVRKPQNAFDEKDNDYFIEDHFGNIYLHRKNR